MMNRVDNMTWPEKYVYPTEHLNNYELLVLGTKEFKQLMYFMETFRDYKNLNLKIGWIKYEDWTADLYCILDEEKGVYFKHIRDFDEREWESKTLTEQLIYALCFDEMEIHLNFDIINEIWKLLSDADKEHYDALWDDVFITLW